MKVSPDQLRERQAWPLDKKVRWAVRQIRIWYDYWDGKVYVAFSGGKDSTALLHLVRSLYPDVPAVFCNTGLEFPEIISFVKSTENVITLKPKMTFRAVLEKYGYPVVSKQNAQRIEEIRSARANGNESWARRQQYGERNSGQSSFHLPKKWWFLLNAPFKISERCCTVMKKNPSKVYDKETGQKRFIGTMAADSMWRGKQYLEYGCNAYQTKNPSSRPLSIWTEANVWEYIRSRNIPYCSIYDMGYESTGCIFCAFGAHMESPPNRFQLMEKTHPKLWKYCMDKLGMREVLEYVGVPITGRGILDQRGAPRKMMDNLRRKGGRS